MATKCRILLLVVSLVQPWLFPRAQPPGAWSSTGFLQVRTAYQKAVTLKDGRVLISGGAATVGYDALYRKTCEIYDLAMGTWTLTDSLETGRYFHTMTVLQDGKVLVAGGAYSGGSTWIQLARCEIYDPSTGHWTSAAPLHLARAAHTATMLPDGKVLVVGGNYAIPMADAYPTTCELYDPAADSWTLTDSLRVPRRDHTAHLLSTGKVLVAGGYYAPTFPGFIYLRECEVYDPVSGKWSITDSLHQPFSSHVSVTLPDSEILVIGGGATGAFCELFDPRTMAWIPTGALQLSRHGGHSASLLRNGEILVVGGAGTAPKCELYNTQRGSWVFTDSLPYDLRYHAATRLSNGKILVSGGVSYRLPSGEVATSLLFDVNSATAVPLADSRVPLTYSLSAYPNPFNPTTTIRYGLPHRSHVTLTVFNTLGQTVAELVDSDIDAGPNEVQFNATALASGVYFYRLQVGSYVQTRSFCVLR